MAIESSGAGRLAKGASNLGGVGSLAKGWLTGKYFSGGSSDKGGSRERSAADWQNEENAKKLDYQRSIETEKRQSKQKRSEARSAEKLRQKASEFDYGIETRRRNQSLSDLNLDKSIKGIKRTPTSFEVSRDTSYSRPSVVNAGGSRQTPSGTPGVVQGTQFNAPKPRKTGKPKV